MGFLPTPTVAEAVQGKLYQALRGGYHGMQGLTRREFRRLCSCFHHLYGSDMVRQEVDQFIAARDDWDTEPDERFWEFCNERHHIYLKKDAGEPWPWTDDPILQEYQFTNVYRDLDRVTRELFKRLPDSLTPAAQLFEVGKFRLFNWPETYDRLPVPWDEEQAKAILHATKGEIFRKRWVPTSIGSRLPNIDWVCRGVSTLLEKSESLAAEMLEANTLRRATEMIEYVPSCGPDVAYEIVSDLRHLFLRRATDIMTWACPDSWNLGLRRLGLYGDRVYGMRTLLAESQQPGVLGPHMRPMEMCDIHHSLYAFVDYEDVRLGDRPRPAKYRAT